MFKIPPPKKNKSISFMFMKKIFKKKIVKSHIIKKIKLDKYHASVLLV